MRRDSVSIREWVVKTDDVGAEVAARCKRMDTAVRPVRAILAKIVRRQIEHQFEQQLRQVNQQLRPDPDQVQRTLDEIPPLVVDYFIRVQAEMLLAWYWSQHPDPEGFTLPAVSVGPYPWNVPPSTVHAIDLADPTRALIELPFDALAKQRSDLERVAKAELKVISPVSEAAVALILPHVKLLKERAADLPLVRDIHRAVITHALRAPTRAERDRADRLRHEIDRAVGPDFRSDVLRREDQLALLFADYKELAEKIEPLHDELRRSGPTPALVERFRILMNDSRLMRHHLTSWAQLDLRAVVLDLLGKYPCRARELLKGTRPKTRRDLLRLAERANAIDDCWKNFVEDSWTAYSPEQQRALFPSLPPLPETAALTRLLAAIARGDEAAFLEVEEAIAALPGGAAIVKGIRAGQIPEATALGILQFYRLVPNDAARAYLGRWVRWLVTKGSGSPPPSNP